MNIELSKLLTEINAKLILQYIYLNNILFYKAKLNENDIQFYIFPITPIKKIITNVQIEIILNINDATLLEEIFSTIKFTTLLDHIYKNTIIVLNTNKQDSILTNTVKKENFEGLIFFEIFFIPCSLKNYNFNETNSFFEDFYISINQTFLEKYSFEKFEIIKLFLYKIISILQNNNNNKKIIIAEDGIQFETFIKNYISNENQEEDFIMLPSEGIKNNLLNVLHRIPPMENNNHFTCKTIHELSNNFCFHSESGCLPSIVFLDNLLVNNYIIPEEFFYKYNDRNFFIQRIVQQFERMATTLKKITNEREERAFFSACNSGDVFEIKKKFYKIDIF